MAHFSIGDQVPSTPFYYYDLGVLKNTLKSCASSASKRGFAVHYALKANVEPQILKTIAAAGFGADCVSGWEVEAAIENGFAPSDIVFAGVGKSDHEIRYALSKGIFCFNCESLQEIEIINDIATEMGVCASIALRINPAVEPDTHHYIATGNVQSKFGISYPEVKQTIDRLAELSSIKIIGLHFHIGSGILNFSGFEELAVKANEVNKWFLDHGIAVAHLNMGGGLGIDYSKPDCMADFEDYFDLFARLLQPHEGQKVHFELGRSLVASCGDLITRVLFCKTTASGEKFLIVDAGMNDLIRPALYSAAHHIENLSSHGALSERYYIGGPVCESSDVFAYDIEFPHSKRGDVLAIRSVGAYGSIMSSHYNLRPLATPYFSF